MFRPEMTPHDWIFKMKNASVRKLLTIVSFGMSSCLVEASPKIEFVGMAAPDVIEIVIQAGRVNVGRQVRYVKQDGDAVKESGHRRTLYRNRKKIGVLIGPDGDILRPFDTFGGEVLDMKWSDNKASYWIESATDARYRRKLRPVEVHRKSRPTGVARTDDWKFEAPMEHHVYLALPHPLRADAKYEISFAGDRFGKREFVYRPLMLRSEAVHVSHIGFHPDDPAKVAFLSCWMGSGGGLKYANGLSFHVVADETGAIVYSGKNFAVKVCSGEERGRLQEKLQRNRCLRDGLYQFQSPGPI